MSIIYLPFIAMNLDFSSIGNHGNVSILMIFSQRGFEVAVPGLNREKVKPEIFSDEAFNYKGLARLLIMEHKLAHVSRKISTFHFFSQKNNNLGEEDKKILLSNYIQLRL